jgi:hypothetical protein
MIFSGVVVICLGVSLLIHSGSCSQLFSDPGVAISEASSAHQFSLHGHPNPNTRISPAKKRFNQPHGCPRLSKGSETLDNLFDGVYPTVNLTWLGKKSQSFVTYVDTGSSDTGVVSKYFQCYSLKDTSVPLPPIRLSMGTAV